MFLGFLKKTLVSDFWIFFGFYAFFGNIGNIGKNSIKSAFSVRSPKKASDKGRFPSQELEEGPCSGPYLFVLPLIYLPQLNNRQGIVYLFLFHILINFSQ